MEKLYSMKEAKELLGVKTWAIQKWDRTGKIKCLRTVGGRRVVPESEIRRLRGERIQTDAVIYARVSSYDQKKSGDLDRQVIGLKKVAKQKYRNVYIITDVGSGLNERRKGLRKLLNLVFTRTIKDVFITYEDRLTRFGFGYLKKICEHFGTNIVVINHDPKEERDLHRELVKDILSLVASMSGRLYGLRSHKRNKIIKMVRNEIRK